MKSSHIKYLFEESSSKFSLFKKYDISLLFAFHLMAKYAPNLTYSQGRFQKFKICYNDYFKSFSYLNNKSEKEDIMFLMSHLNDYILNKNFTRYGKKVFHLISVYLYLNDVSFRNIVNRNIYSVNDLYEYTFSKIDDYPNIRIYISNYNKNALRKVFYEKLIVLFKNENKKENESFYSKKDFNEKIKEPILSENIDTSFNVKNFNSDLKNKIIEIWNNEDKEAAIKKTKKYFKFLYENVIFKEIDLSNKDLFELEHEFLGFPATIYLNMNLEEEFITRIINKNKSSIHKITFNKIIKFYRLDVNISSFKNISIRE